MMRILLSISFVFTFLVACTIHSFCQNKLVEKANEHFSYNQFAEAATLYEQALAEISSKAKSQRSSAAIKAKLAYCYRMNNRMDKAEVLYADLASEEKPKAEIYLYYAEALMSNEKYAEAKKWLLQYQRLEPTDPKGRLLLEACEKAPLLQPYFPYLEIQEFSHNSPADDNAPVGWQGGIVFSSDRNSGIKLLKEKSGWTGRDYLDLYFSEKNADGSFSAPKQFSGKLSESRKNIGNASFAADGSEVYFTRNDNELNKQKTYTLQLYRAEATGGDRWRNVTKLPFCSSAYNFMHPAISPDGQWLFFASNKAGGQGGTDLWVAQRKSDGWEKPLNLGSVVNTPANEGFPFIDAQGRLFFCSKGHPGFGGFDIFVTEKDENGNWKTPLNLGKPINSSLDDISIFIASDRRSGMFTSSRNGGDDDIYLFRVFDQPPFATRVVPPAPAIASQEPLPTAAEELPFAKIEPSPAGQEKKEIKTDKKSATESTPAKPENKQTKTTENLTAQPEKEVASIVEKPATKPASAEPKKEETKRVEKSTTQPISTKPQKEDASIVEKPATKPASAESKKEETGKVEKSTIFTKPPKEEAGIVTKPATAEPPLEETLEQKPAVVDLPARTNEEKTEKPATLPFTPTGVVEAAPAAPGNPQLPPDVPPSAGEGSQAIHSAESPIQIIEPLISGQTADLPTAASNVSAALPSLFDFEKRILENTLREGDCFRLDSAVFDGNVWQLTPRVSAVLDRLVRLLKQNPFLQVEICAHTESLGIDEDNLRLSQNRAQKAMEYMVREGIAAKRLSAKGYGETMLLNHCHNGATCSLEEHLFNQRLEVKVVKAESRR